MMTHGQASKKVKSHTQSSMPQLAKALQAKNATLCLRPTNAWKAGYVYNYTATFNDTNVEPEAEPIEFTVSVNDWEDDLNGDSQENDDIDLNL